MTDKGIIVDSINVSECEFLWKEKLPKKFCNNGNLDCDCNSNPNCYFKQLKRKEQECEAINLTNERLVTEKYAMNEEIIKYKQTLDEIEKLIPKFDTSDGCSYGDYDCENCSDLDEDVVCTYKLKKTIKNIINKTKE